MNEDYIKGIYDELGTNYDLGSFEDFSKNIQENDEYRKSLYDDASQSLDLGDYAAFEQNVKKKQFSLEDYAVTPKNVAEEYRKSQEEQKPFSIVPSTSPSAEEIKTSKSKQKERTTTAIGDVMRATKASSQQALGGVLGFANFGTQTLLGPLIRPLVRAQGGTDEDARLLIETAQSGSLYGGGVENQRKLNRLAAETEAKMAPIEGSMWENLTKGKDGERNVGAAVESFFRGVGSSLPYLAETALTAGAGSAVVLSTIGATAAAQQYGALEGRTDMTENQKIFNGWLYGAGEAAGELFTAGIMKGVAKAFKGATPEIKGNIISSAVKNIAKNFGIEGGSEAFTQIEQNVTAILTEEDPKRSVLDGVFDATIIGGLGFGAVSGVAETAAPYLGRKLASPEEVKTVQENTLKQSTLIEQINEADNETTKKVLNDEFNKIQDESTAIMDANVEKAKKLTPEQATRILELDATETDLKNKLERGEVTEEEKANVESVIKGIQEEKIAITEQPTGQVTEQPAKEVTGEPTVEPTGEVKPANLKQEQVIGGQENAEGSRGKNQQGTEEGAPGMEQGAQTVSNVGNNEQAGIIEQPKQEEVVAPIVEEIKVTPIKTIEEFKAEAVKLRNVDPKRVREIIGGKGKKVSDQEIDDYVAKLDEYKSIEEAMTGTSEFFDSEVTKLSSESKPASNVIKDKEGNVAYMATGGVEKTNTPDEIRAEIERLNGLTKGVKAEIVEDESLLPKEERDRIVGSNVWAYHKFGSDTSQMILKNIPSVDVARQVWIHENLVHGGIERKFKTSKEYLKAMNGVIATLGGRRMALDEIVKMGGSGLLYMDIPANELAEEYLAFLSKKIITGENLETLTPKERTAWESIKKLFTDFIYKIVGADVPLSDADIANLIIDAAEASKKGGESFRSAGSAMAAAESKSMEERFIESLAARNEEVAKDYAAIKKKGGNVNAAIKEYLSSKGKPKTEVKTEPTPTKPTAKTEPTTEKTVVKTEPKETSESKTRKYEIGRKVVEDSTLPQDVKDDLLKEGIEYVPRGRDITLTEAKELISVYDSTEGGLEKIAAAVYDITNGILPDTRVILNVYVAEQYSKRLSDATTMSERLDIRDKLAKAFVFGQESGKKAGQAVEAQKRWGSILARDPEAIVAIKRKKQSDNNNVALDKMAEDLKTAQTLLEEQIKNFRQEVETQVNEEIDKIANKKFGKVNKQKIDDFFKGLEIKDDKMFDATIGIPIAVYNGSLQVIKRAVLAGADLVNAINQGIEYIDKWYKENYAKGTIPAPEWNKEDYRAKMDERLKPLTKKVKTIKHKLSVKAEEKLIDTIYAKMEVATKPQLKRLVRQYVTVLEEEGAVSEQRFRDMFARAIGLDVLNQEEEQQIRLSAQSLNNARKKADRLMEVFGDYMKEAEKPKEERDDTKMRELGQSLEDAKGEAKKARFEAQKAAQKLDKILQEDSTLGQTLTSLIQGNLLTPISLVTNVIGNFMFMPVRSARSMVSAGLDYMVYGLAKAYTPAIKSIDTKKHPRLARILSGLPEPKRVYNNFASVRGYGRGFWRGVEEGGRQVITGQLPEDVYNREVSKAIEPFKAFIRVRDQLSGKEQLKFDKFLSDFLEALPGGYMAEGMFRMLNLGDKPFRRGAEMARLSEIASLKKLTGIERDKFMNFPDEESLEESRKAGNVAVFQQDSFVSKVFKYIDSELKKSPAGQQAKQASIIAKTLGQIFKATQFPYIKTPVNLMAEAFDYSIPIYAIARGVTAMKKGNRREALDYYGKAIIGSMIMSGTIWLIQEGLLTGPPDDEDKIKQAQYTGKPGYSLNIDALWRKENGGTSEWKQDDRVWNIQRFGVPSMIMMGVARAYKDIPPESMKELGWLERNVAMAPSIIGSAFDQSFLSGTASFITAFTEGGPALNNWLINTSKAMSAIIYPNTFAQISQTFFDDNYIRESRNMYDKDHILSNQMTNTFKDRMFMGKDLPTKVTIWGEPVLRIPEGRSWPYMIFDTRKEVNYQKSSFGVRMWEWYENYKFVDEDRAKAILPSLPSPTSEVGWDGENMTPEEVNELQRSVGLMRKSYVENFMNSAEWVEMSDDERIGELEKIYRECASKVKSKMFMLDVLEKGYPEVWKYITDNDLIPVPTKTVTVRLGKDKVRLDEEQTKEMYSLAQRYFGEMMGGKDMVVTPENKDKVVKVTSEIWSAAKQRASAEMAREIKSSKPKQ